MLGAVLAAAASMICLAWDTLADMVHGLSGR
jgi:hypothetical protein